MLLFPYFTEQDDTLIKQGAVRDYLGLQSVWSSVARQLEPNLSGQVTNIQGIKAVGLIYHIMNNNRNFDDKMEKNSRLFFRYMEGLFEYYLVHEMNEKPCYGARAINGDKLSLKINLNAGTVVMGLYQYYRGTCRRAGIINDDWTLDNKLESIYKALIPQDIEIKKLMDSFKGLMKKEDKTFSPFEIMKDKDIKSLFNSVFGGSDSSISKYLDGVFYKDLNLRMYASSCSEVINSENAVGSKAFQVHQKLLSQPTDYPRLDSMQHFLDCEPFLCLLNDLFHSLLNAGTLKAFGESAVIQEEAVTERARAFIRLEQVNNTEFSSARFKELYQLAHIIIDKQWDIFAETLFQYHEQLMLVRKLGPVAMIDNGKVESLQDIGRYENEQILDRIKNQHIWNNGYYIYSTASIYSQIQKELEGTVS
jgi:hypothetical protein